MHSIPWNARVGYARLILEVRHHRNDTRNASVVIGTQKLWKFQIITQDVLLHFHSTLTRTHYTASTHYGWQWPSYPLYLSYPHPPVSTNRLPQAPVYNFSGCTVYFGNNDCLASDRYHRNDIVFSDSKDP